MTGSVESRRDSLHAGGGDESRLASNEGIPQGFPY